MTLLAPRPEPAARDRDLPLLPRTDPIARLPILILFPHSRCNCRCLMCDIWRAEGTTELSVRSIRRWIPEWRELGVERLVLSGGEPLMHTRLADVGRLLADAGIRVTMISTGILLRRHARALAGFCDDVVVSLDGPRPIHDRIRNLPGAYDKLAAGVRAIGEIGSIRISGRCTVQKLNFESLRATVAASRELGLERISFLAVDVSSDAFNRPGGWKPEQALPVSIAAEDLPRLAEELARLEREHAEEFASGFIAESPSKLRRRLHDYFAAASNGGEFPPVDCNAPWVSSVIEADGTVRPCFFQPAFGNLHQAAGLAEILNSSEAVAWRRGLDTRRNEICRRCVCSLRLRETPGVPPPAATAEAETA